MSNRMKESMMIYLLSPFKEFYLICVWVPLLLIIFTFIIYLKIKSYVHNILELGLNWTCETFQFAGFFWNFLSGHLRWGGTHQRHSVTIKQLCLLPLNSFLWLAKMWCQFFQDGKSVHERGPLQGINLRLDCSFLMRRSATICHKLVNRCKQAEVFFKFLDESFLKKTWKPP